MQNKKTKTPNKPKIQDTKRTKAQTPKKTKTTNVKSSKQRAMAQKSFYKPSRQPRKKAENLKNPAKNIIIAFIVIIIIAVLTGIIVSLNFNHKAVAERELNSIAHDYYESYYYEKFLQNGAATKSLEQYSQSGTPAVYLRQLLHFDNDRHADSAKIFNQPDFTCDTNKTSVKFFPVYPYGKTDYTIKFSYSCE